MDRRRVCMKKVNGLADLPEELLTAVFKCCSLVSLGRLAQCCKLFRDLVYEDTIWRRFVGEKAFLFTTDEEDFVSRQWTSLNVRDKLRLSRNWLTGDAQYHVLTSTGRKRYLPWVQLAPGGRLWATVGRKVELVDLPESFLAKRRGGRRRRNDEFRAVVGRVTMCIGGSHADDVTRFRVDDGVLVTASRDCGIRGWNEADGAPRFVRPFAHTTEVTAIDLVKGVMASGCKSHGVKLWRLGATYLREAASVLVSDRVLSCAISPDLSKCAVGLAAKNVFQAISMVDVQTGSLMTDWMFPNPAQMENEAVEPEGVLGIEWSDSNIFFSVGYDTALRVHDLRLGRTVHCWPDPYGSVLYCLDTDRDNLIVTGCARNGIVRLWDWRRPKSLLKELCISTRSTPVYCLAFDNVGLYVALESSLVMVDFQHFARNYSFEGHPLTTLRSVNYCPDAYT